MTRVASASISWPALITEGICSAIPSAADAKLAGARATGSVTDALSTSGGVAAVKSKPVQMSAGTAPAQPTNERRATRFISFFCAFVPTGRRGQARERRNRSQARTSRGA